VRCRALILVLLVATSACVARGERTLVVNGRTRTYRVHVPGSQTPGAKAPLVLVFHGGGGDASGMERLSRFDALADREGFLVVYPEGLGRHWNDGRASNVEATKGADDVAFVSALLDALEKELPVDEKRVYATGISNGGIFSHHLGIRLSKRLAAVAPVAGGIADLGTPQPVPERPVSVFMLVGTEDPLMPYGGGAVARKNGRIVATDESVAFWRKADGIESKPVEAELPDADPRDGCRVKSFTWSGGKEGTAVTLYRIDGGGHTWPGGSQYLPKLFIGRTCRDFDATKVIWDFFRAHPRR
jgi:polyhydroxybutyrate depolymerase